MKRALVILLALAIHATAQTPQVPVTGNLGTGGIFPLVNSPAIVFASDADHTMAYPEMSGSGGVLVVTSITLTATRKLIVPNTKGFTWIIENATSGGQSITVIGMAGTGVTIPNGAVATVFTDGTNVLASAAISSLTTSGSGGPATLSPAGALNIPVYASSGGGLPSQAVVFTGGSSACHAGFSCTSLGGAFDMVLNPSGAPTTTTLSWSSSYGEGAVSCIASAWLPAATSSSWSDVSGGTSWAVTAANAGGGTVTYGYSCTPK